MGNFYRAMVTIHQDSGVPEDDCVNTWYFDADVDPDTTETTRLAHIQARLDEFYSAIAGDLYPSTVSDTAGLKVYDLEDVEPRAPILDTTFNIGTAGGGGLPSEVAIVLSFQGEQESGTPIARRRGRVYLGPVATSCVVAGVGGSRPNSSIRTVIANAAAQLRTTPSDGGRPLWAVFSPTELAVANSFDDAFNDVDSGWVDDAWDIQRRRGLKATARTNWS